MRGSSQEVGEEAEAEVVDTTFQQTSTTQTSITERKQLKQLAKYAHIEIQGHYIDAPQFLLDNQIDNQVLGYHVFTPFLIENLNTIILVNRGWVVTRF